LEITVIWSDSAIEDLQNIFDYYLVKANRKTALKITNFLVDRTLALEYNPRIGQIEELLQHRKEEIRYIIEGNYKIIYFIEDSFLVISTVFDCRQSPEKLLKRKFH
jgi:toxin ParE1/3/4